MDAPSPPGSPPQSESRVRQRVFAVALVVLAAIVAALWFDTRGRIGATQEELARRLHDIEGESREARTLGRQAQEALRDAQAKIGALEDRLAESQNQQVALEALYQELSRNRDEWQLAEIEQVLAIAQQQLQLSGNVRAALLALQLAESRLSRADRPQFLPVRRALSRDIERLKSLPALDVPGMSLALDRLVAAVDALPLAFDERVERRRRRKGGDARAAAGRRLFRAPGRRSLEGIAPARRGAQGRCARAAAAAAAAGLVPARESEAAAAQRAPRAADARRGGLPRGPARRAGLDPALLRRPRKGSQSALAQLKQLSSASISFEPPTITDSLEAVRGFKSRRERSGS